MKCGEMTRTGTLAAVLALLTVAPLAAQQTVEMPRRDRGMDAEMQEVFSVGTFDGADWETFGDVGGVAFDGRGNLYIMDRQTDRMIVVGPDGGFKYMWGESGEGPGEWREASRAAVFRDGTVAVADMGHGSYQIFTSEGEFIGTAPLRDGAISRVGNLLPDPRGGALYNGGGPTNMSMSWDGSGGRPPDAPGPPHRAHHPG